MSYSTTGKTCLRGGEEHWCLKLSQLHCEVVTVTGKNLIRYMYVKHGSKNHSGGFKLLHLGNKIVHQFDNPEASRCDHVRILDLYPYKKPKVATTMLSHNKVVTRLSQPCE